jgi:hypothetical protein
MELEKNFLLKFLDLIIHQKVPKLKLFSQQDLVDKTTAQQPKVQQFESTGFQDPQAEQRHLVTNTTVSAVKLEGKRNGCRRIKGKKKKKF